MYTKARFCPHERQVSEYTMRIKSIYIELCMSTFPISATWTKCKFNSFIEILSDMHLIAGVNSWCKKEALLSGSKIWKALMIALEDWV